MALNDVYLYSVPSDVDADDVRLFDPVALTVIPSAGPLALTGFAPVVEAVTAEGAMDFIVMYRRRARR